MNVIQTSFESKQAERAIIGCIIENHVKAISMCLKLGITENSFYHRDTRCIWESALELNKDGIKCDNITLTECVTRKFRDEDLIFTIEGCIEDNFLIANLKYYIQIVRDKETKRIIREILVESVDALPKLKAEESLSNVKFKISSVRTENVSKRPTKDIIAGNVDKFNQSKSKGYTGLPVRWPNLQTLLTGSKPGKITVIAARPGEGKTTFAANLMSYLAASSIPCGIISIEMEEGELYDRIIGDVMNVDISKMDGGDFTQKELNKYKEGGRKVCDWPLWIEDGTLNIAQICSWIQDKVVEHDVKAVMIDYLQIIPSMDGRTGNNRNLEISGFMSSLCNVAKQTGVHLYLLSQLSRLGANIKPRLEHLRDSGSIEQDAYTVIFISPDPQTEKGVFDTDIPTVVDVAKNRGGRIGETMMRFRKHNQKFCEMQTMVTQNGGKVLVETSSPELPEKVESF